MLSMLQTSPLRCLVCNLQAYGLNYGVFSCNACKMFFRRVITMNLHYECAGKKTCFKNIEASLFRPKCRECRFRKCLEVGMKFVPDDTQLVQEHKSLTLKGMRGKIRSLLELDSRRTVTSLTRMCSQDPTIEQLINRRGFTINASEGDVSSAVSQPPIEQQVFSDWSFCGTWTSVEFLNSFDFMSLIRPEEKHVLLKSFTMKSYLLSCAFRSSIANSNVLINPDGSDVFPESIQEMPQFSEEYVTRIRKLLVEKLTDLKITSEEYILATVILFCNPATPGMSQLTQQILGEQQRKHCNLLLDFCKMTRGEQGPVRFQEIVSIGNVMGKCFEDAQHLLLMLQISHHPEVYNCKKLFMEILNQK